MTGLPPAVYCHGGPLNGRGFTADDWRVRSEAARNMQRATANYSPRGPDDEQVPLPAVLAKYDVTIHIWRGRP